MLSVEKCLRFRDRAMASFIIDDVTGQSREDAAAFAAFSAWAAESGIKGECSVIPGLARDSNGAALPLDDDYCAEAARASHEHLDAYMEVMTHRQLYDFAAGRMRSDGPHEGVWMIDRVPTRDDYRAYFGNIIKVASAKGVRHAGVTLPGCGCADCVAFKQRMRIKGAEATDFNPEVFAALLDLLRENKLSSSVCGLFVGCVREGPADISVMAEDGSFAVYDTPPGIKGDYFGRWENDAQYLDIDQYVTADGRGGRLAELIAQGTPTLIYYGHWQSLRPDRGVGNAGFKQVAARLKEHYGDQIVWMRPTEIAAYRHTERHTRIVPRPSGTGGFELSLPFAPLHPLTLRVCGPRNLRLQTPNGKIIAPWSTLAGEGVALFDVLPENGTYEAV